MPQGDTVLFLRLPEELQRGIQTELIAAITNEPERYVRTQISDTIASLASVLIYNNKWPDIFPALYAMCEPAQPNHALKVCALSILGQLSDAADNLLPQVPNMHAVFLANLQRELPLTVRVECVVACCKVIPIIEEKSHTTEYQKFLPYFFQTLTDALDPANGDEDLTKRVLSALVEVATEEGKFFQPQLHALIPLMYAIGADTNKMDLDDGIRQYACEVLVATANSAPTMVRKNQSFIRHMLLVCLSLMLDVEEDPQWGQKEETNDFFDNSNFDFGEDNIDRIALAIKGAKLWPILKPILEQHLANKSDWRARHAGLCALSQACSVLQFSELPVKEVSHFILDEHPRVRFQAVQCLGQFPMDHSEVTQVKKHKIIFPALMKAIEDFANPRIQAHAASALLNMVDGCPGRIVKLYLTPLMQALLTLLQRGHKMVQDRVMPVMACIAGQVPKAFQPWYDQVVPPMIYIIQNATTRDTRMLRAHAMESVSYIGMYVGRERFHNDAKLIVQLFLGIMQQSAANAAGKKKNTGATAASPMDSNDDDYSEQHMLQAWTRICQCLKEEFVPILPYVMPTAFEAITRKQDGEGLPVHRGGKNVHRLVDEHGNEIPLEHQQPEEEEEETNVSKDGYVKGINVAAAASSDNSTADKPNAFYYTNYAHTTAMEEKASAMGMVTSFCFDLGEHFMPYVKQTAEIFIPLLAHMHDEIRSNAIDAMPHLLRSAVLGFQKGRANVQFVKALFEAMADQMLDTMRQEPDAEILQLMIVALQDVITEAGVLTREVIDAAQLNIIGQAIFRLLKESHDRMERREQLLRQEEEAGDMDEERIVEIESRNAAEDALHTRAAALIASLIKSHGADFIPTFDGLFTEIKLMMGVNMADSTKRIAIFVVDDIFEYLGPLAAKYFPYTLEPMCIYASDMNTEHSVRQASAYGLHVAAKHGGPAFQQYVPEIAKRLVASVQKDPTYLQREAHDPVGGEFIPVDANDEGESAIDKVQDDEDAPHQDDEEEDQVADDDDDEDDDDDDEDSRHACIDNLVSAIGAIAYYQNRPDLFPTWLSFLPLRADEAEAPVVYGMLLDLLDQNHPALLGENFANLPKILSVFLVLVDTTFLKNKELRARVGKFFQNVKSMPPALLQQVVPTLHPELQQKLSNIMAAI